MIELKHICKTFDSGGGEVEALKDVSLTIEKGEICGIIGMSGAGKSTCKKTGNRYGYYRRKRRCDSFC